MTADIGNMKILAFDTSWDFGVVATVFGMKIVEKFCGRSPRVASEGLLPWIMEVTSRSGWKQGDIDLVAVGRGPGSFTGTRIAVSVAKAMAEVLDIPLVSVSSVESIALTVGRPGQRVAVVMDARKGEVMAALYAVSAGQTGGGVSPSECPEASVLREPSLMSPALAREFLEIEAAAGGPLVACGNGFARYADFFSGISVQGGHATPLFGEVNSPNSPPAGSRAPRAPETRGALDATRRAVACPPPSRYSGWAPSPREWLLSGNLPAGIPAGIPVHGGGEGPLIDPLAVAALALRRCLKGERDDPAVLEPVYLRSYL